MGRMRQGWALTKKSWGILKTNKHLSLFVICGALMAMAAAAVVMVPGAILIAGDKTVPGAILIAVGLYIATFIVLYFNVGLAASADTAMRGQTMTFGEGMKMASQRTGPIAGWALFSVTVNLILNAIRSEAGWLGQIVTGLLAIAWNLVTFLVIPVIALEGLGPIAALKRSASLFKKRWGQQVTGNIAIGGIVALALILPAAVIGFFGVVLVIGTNASDITIAFGAALVVLAVAIVIVAQVIIGALRGIFGVALFRFADTGESAGVFSAEELQGSIQQKKRKKKTPFG